MRSRQNRRSRLQQAALILCAAFILVYSSPVLSGDTVGLPAPTSAAVDAFPAQKLLTLRGAQLPDGGVLGGHPPAHGDVF